MELLRGNIILILLFAFMTLCLIFAIAVFTNEKFRDKVISFLPFSNAKNTQAKGGIQPGFAVAVLVIVASVLLAYFF